MHINDLLRIATERKASDLHLKVGAYPVIRVDGTLIPLVEMKRLIQEDTIAMAFSIMSARQKAEVQGQFRARHRLFACRASAGSAATSSSSAARWASSCASSRPDHVVDELAAAARARAIASEQRGLILCTGTTGSGKSTTLAAMLDFINSTRNEHIMTIEDPIEFLHRDKKSIVNQREVEVDTQSFAHRAAERAAAGSRT